MWRILEESTCRDLVISLKEEDHLENRGIDVRETLKSILIFLLLFGVSDTMALTHNMIYLSTVVGLTPGGSSTVHIYTQTIHRTTQITPSLEIKKLFRNEIRYEKVDRIDQNQGRNNQRDVVKPVTNFQLPDHLLANRETVSFSRDILPHAVILPQMFIYRV